jgi:hypothetical protein
MDGCHPQVHAQSRVGLWDIPFRCHVKIVPKSLAVMFFVTSPDEMEYLTLLTYQCWFGVDSYIRLSEVDW